MLVLTVTVAGAAFALVSTVEALWQLYLYVGILGGVGACRASTCSPLGPAAAGFLYDLTGAYMIPFGAAPLAVPP